MLSVEQFLHLVGKGEDSQVEFKVSLPSKVRELAEEVCGLANADGGFVFIGVDNDNQIVGASIDNAKRSAVIDSLGEITPQLPFEFYPLAVGGIEVWVVEVPRGNNLPYIYSGSVFVRQGSTCRKLRSRDEMMNFFCECNSLHFDSAPITNFDLMAELDKENFRVFCRKARIFSAKDLTEMLSVSLSTVERNLSFLQKNGFIKRESSDRYGKWIVLKKK